MFIDPLSYIICFKGFIMKKVLQSAIFTLGLAIFSMLFGAGNLMYPLAVGIFSGTHTGWGIIGFNLTAICLPLIGILTMILYQGDYELFFSRLGKRSGKAMISICMLVMGPIIAMPRIVTLSHTMISPFLPFQVDSEPTMFASFIFAVVFLGITFLFTYRESKIVDILGMVVSPALLASLCFIICKGLMQAHKTIESNNSAGLAFFNSILRGYETLDLIGALFFSSIILTIIRNNNKNSAYSEKEYAVMGFKGGIIGTSLLALIYIGMSYLGAFYGEGLEHINSGELFREISLRILGSYGTCVIATAVLLACLSTAIALAAVIAEYAKKTFFHQTLSYGQSLALTLIACIPLSTAGLGSVLSLTAGPLTFIGYPMLITLTLCNLLHKLYGLQAVRIPVLLTFLVAISAYFYYF